MTSDFKPNWGGLAARIVLGVGAVALFILLFWLVFDRAAVEPPEPDPVPEPLPLTQSLTGDDDAPVIIPAEVGAADETPASTVAEPDNQIASPAWRLAAVDGVVPAGPEPLSIRCRAMSTDRHPGEQVIAQLRYRLAQTAGPDGGEAFHISQINNYYRCDLDLVWRAEISGDGSIDCLDLDRLGSSLQLVTGQGSEARRHPVLPPWAAIADCPKSSGFAGQLVVSWRLGPDQPNLAEITYRGTFRAFIPKTDYARIIASLCLDNAESGGYSLSPVRIRRL